MALVSQQAEASPRVRERQSNSRETPAALNEALLFDGALRPLALLALQPEVRLRQAEAGARVAVRAAARNRTTRLRCCEPAPVRPMLCACIDVRQLLCALPLCVCRSCGRRTLKVT